MPGPQIADIGGAWVAVSGILAALLARATTGRGRLVDVSLVEAATSFAALHLGPALLGFPVPPAGQGMLDGGLPSYGLYRTADDRWLAVAALEPKFFAALCERLGLGELTAEAYGGGEAAEQVRALLARTFAGAPLATWQERLAGLDACVEPVLLPEEVCGDAHLGSRGLFPRPGVLATPLHLGPPAAGPAPGLGEHTREVLSEAGLTPAENRRPGLRRAPGGMDARFDVSENSSWPPRTLPSQSSCNFKNLRSERLAGRRSAAGRGLSDSSGRGAAAAHADGSRGPAPPPE